MTLVAFVIILCSVLCVSTSSAIDRNEAAVLELFPGAQIRRPEGSRLVVNCTSHADETPVAMLWKASRAHDNMRSEPIDNHSVALVFESLHRSDAGVYICYLILPRGKKYIKRVHVAVLPTSIQGGLLDPCASTEFRCNNGLCIFLQYRCDNLNDCEDMSDEEDCGDDPCENKFMCKNNRCISFDLVCDKFHNNDCDDMSDETCTFISYGDWYSPQSAATSHPQQTSVDVQMRWLKTTVYSVIGCTVGVVLLIAVLVIAIFRIKMKRTVARRQLMFIERRRQEHAASRHPFRFPEMDPFLSSQGRAPPYSHNNIILNVNNGVQYVPGLEFTSIMEAPPPYSDSGGNDQTARSDSPPPPYSTIDRRTRDNPIECENLRGENSDTIPFTVTDTVNNNYINSTECSHVHSRNNGSPQVTEADNLHCASSMDSNNTEPKSSSSTVCPDCSEPTESSSSTACPESSELTGASSDRHLIGVGPTESIPDNISETVSPTQTLSADLGFEPSDTDL